MKIVQINETCGSNSIGRTTLELATYLKENGHTSIVAAPTNSSSYSDFFQIGNKFGRIIHALLSRITGLQGYFSIFSTLRLLAYFNKIKPDIVHLRNLHGNFINLPLLTRYLAKYKISTVITLHDCWFYTGKCTYYVPAQCNKWQKQCGNCPLLHIDNVNPTFFFDTTKKCINDKKRLFYKIEKLSVIGVSEWVTKEASISHFKNRHPKTIYNWIDSETFKYRVDTNLKRRFNFVENDFIILFVTTSINRIKGYDVLNSLSKLLPENDKIIIVGSNPLNLPIPQRVIHIEHTNDAIELSEYYSMADVCINTTFYETFGKVTAEALCCGTPTIVYNNTASPELIGHNCGYVIDQNKGTNAIVNAINKIKKNGRSFYSQHCVEFANKTFNKEQNINEYINLYKNTLVNK